jgi:hypothetical protein
LCDAPLGIASSCDWFLHHDNAPANTALSVQQFLVKNMTVFTHPPYSPDLALYDFFLFPRMKCQMKWKRFAEVSEMKKKTLEVSKNISSEQFQKYFQRREKLYKCIESQEEYFEGE